MSKFEYASDFSTYNVGDDYKEYATPGSSIPGKIVMDDGKKVLKWTGPTWLSFIRCWQPIDVTGGAVRMKMGVKLVHSSAQNWFYLLQYGPNNGWGHAVMYVKNGMLRLEAYANYSDAFKWQNALASVDVAVYSPAQVYEWDVTINKTSIVVMFEGKPVINVDIPTAKQGFSIDSARFRCPLCHIFDFSISSTEE